MSSKRPVPNEEGNWVCEDPACKNVNYPRRTECHKCHKKRGAAGDAVVSDYYRRSKQMRGGGEFGASYIFPQPSDLAQPVPYASHGVPSEYHLLAPGPYAQPYPALGMGEPPLVAAGGFGMSSAGGMVLPVVSGAGGGGGGGSAAGAVASQYAVSADAGASWGSRRSTMSAAAEGKRLAEQLVASFATSADPIADAGECLASATLWLQTMKQRVLAGGGGGGAGGGGTGGPLPSDLPPLSAEANAASASLRPVPHAHEPPPASHAASALAPPSVLGGHGAFAHPLLPGASLHAHPSLYLPLGAPPRFDGGGIHFQQGAMGPPAMLNGGAHGAAGGLGGRGQQGRGGSLKPIPKDVRFEEYADRPSDFLKEFGDPAALAPSLTPRHRPQAGENGNWDCKKCANVNFPRRVSCNSCGEKRSEAGDEIVREYVKKLIESAKEAV